MGLQVALCAPEFLYLKEKPGRLDDFALASRLSYFLWSSLPDEELLKLAAQGKQTERMLQSPKAAALTANFLGHARTGRPVQARG